MFSFNKKNGFFVAKLVIETLGRKNCKYSKAENLYFPWPKINFQENNWIFLITKLIINKS